MLREQFFDKKSVTIRPNAIIHSHVIEHLYNPIQEIGEMAELLGNESYMFISAPVIDAMMEDGFTNAMNFEHTYGLTKQFLKYILNKSKLRIVKERDFSKHCVFVAAVKDDKIEDTNNIIHDSSYLYNFFSHYEREIDKIITLLPKSREKTFIFGAHIFTQFLFKFGLKEESFSYILDNDPDKIGNRLYGTGMTVQSPKILKDISNPVVVLKAGQYTEEIKKDILENINSNTRFIL